MFCVGVAQGRDDVIDVAGAVLSSDQLFQLFIEACLPDVLRAEIEHDIVGAALVEQRRIVLRNPSLDVGEVFIDDHRPKGASFKLAAHESLLEDMAPRRAEAEDEDRDGGQRLPRRARREAGVTVEGQALVRRFLCEKQTRRQLLLAEIAEIVPVIQLPPELCRPASQLGRMPVRNLLEEADFVGLQGLLGITTRSSARRRTSFQRGLPERACRTAPSEAAWFPALRRTVFDPVQT